MAKYTFLDLILEVLGESDTPLSSSEILGDAIKKGLLERVGSKGQTPIKTIEAYLYMNAKGENPLLEIVSKSPTRFWIREKELDKDLIPSNKTKFESTKILYSEASLHALLVAFVSGDENFGIYCKTINEKKSIKNKSGLNRWIHPDVVGVYYPINFQKDTFELMQNLGRVPYRLYSFELKRRLTFSNLKSSFFQAVSNSSWANEGYLVFLECNGERDLLDELKRLNQAFGIGVIQLNAESVASSQILFPAQRKEELDLKTLDLLTEKNGDFKDFINHINHNIRMIKSINGYSIKQDKYDAVLQGEEMENHIKNEKII